MTQQTEPRNVAHADALRSPYDIIRENILRGFYQPGELLREVALAEALGVSRTPVREALFRLEHERVLTRSAKGLRVREFTLAEIVSVYDAAIILESEAARLAALHRNTQHVIALRDAAAQGARAVQAREDPLHAMDLYHSELWRTANNPTMTDLLQRLSAQLFGLPEPTSRFEYWEESVTSHEAINDAIERQDPEAAARLMREHMQSGRESAARLMLDRGLSSENG